MKIQAQDSGELAFRSNFDQYANGWKKRYGFGPVERPGILILGKDNWHLTVVILFV
jgi:hypothetical protein